MDALNIEAEYRQALNDNYSTVTIVGQDFEQGDALMELDPIAFRTGASDYADAQAKDGVWVEDDGDYYLADDWNEQYSEDED